MKTKQREELPLRGMLKCPECTRNLTGSRSQSRNGNHYYYYHCQNDCSTRFNAVEVHDEFHDYLKSLTIPSEVSELYMAILEDTFKSNEGDRKKQIQGLKDRNCRYGIPLLSNLSGFYSNANVEIKQKLLGSIFPAKLQFCDGSYRTTILNPALALILQKKNGLENEKTGQDLFEETLSSYVPMTGLEPALYC